MSVALCLFDRGRFAALLHASHALSLASQGDGTQQDQENRARWPCQSELNCAFNWTHVSVLQSYQTMGERRGSTGSVNADDVSDDRIHMLLLRSPIWLTRRSCVGCNVA